MSKNRDPLCDSKVIMSWNKFQKSFRSIFNKENHIEKNGSVNLSKDAAEGWRCYKINHFNRNTPVIGSLTHTRLYKDIPEYLILHSNRWSLGVNEAWIQGGIDKGACFKIVTPETIEYLWDFKRNGPRVFAVELVQLRKSGYFKLGDWMYCFNILSFDWCWMKNMKRGDQCYSKEFRQLDAALPESIPNKDYFIKIT